MMPTLLFAVTKGNCSIRELAINQIKLPLDASVMFKLWKFDDFPFCPLIIIVYSRKVALFVYCDSYHRYADKITRNSFYTPTHRHTVRVADDCLR